MLVVNLLCYGYKNLILRPCIILVWMSAEISVIFFLLNVNVWMGLVVHQIPATRAVFALVNTSSAILGLLAAFIVTLIKAFLPSRPARTSMLSLGIDLLLLLFLLTANVAMSESLSSHNATSAIVASLSIKSSIIGAIGAAIISTISFHLRKRKIIFVDITASRSVHLIDIILESCLTLSGLYVNVIMGLVLHKTDLADAVIRAAHLIALFVGMVSSLLAIYLIRSIEHRR